MNKLKALAFLSLGCLPTEKAFSPQPTAIAGPGPAPMDSLSIDKVESNIKVVLDQMPKNGASMSDRKNLKHASVGSVKNIIKGILK